MSNVEKRLNALEQSAKLMAAQCKPPTSSLSIEDFHRMVREIATRERPERTQAEQIEDFRAGLERMRIAWALRHGQSSGAGETTRMYGLQLDSHASISKGQI